MSENSRWTTSRFGTTLRTSRRAWTSPLLAKVIKRSATGLRAFALASVVRMRSWTNSDAAIPPSISLWWEGPDPSRGPFLGFGTSNPLGLPEAQAQLVELRLDLVDRLLPEVPDVHQLLLGLLDQLRHGVDAFPLQAVVRPYRQAELLDGERQLPGHVLLALGGPERDARGLREVGEQAHELVERGSRRGHGLSGVDRTVRLHVDDEPVAVGHLLHAGVLDGV